MPIERQLRTSRAVVTDDHGYAITAAELVDEIKTKDATRAGHILAAVGAMVERYAPGAPDAIKREAIIRAGGWLAGTPKDDIRDMSAGPLSSSHTPSMRACLRHSGAMSLLSPWKVRRAGAIG